MQTENAAQQMQQKTIALIGGGNMAQAIVFGLLKQSYPADKILVSDPNAHKLALFAQQGVQITQDNRHAAQQAEVLLLAVKPQAMAEVCQGLQSVDFSQKLLISIAAGIEIQRLQQLLPSAQQIVRVMPNTPALVGQGMSGLFASAQVSPANRQFAEQLLNAVGKSLWLENEQQMHAVTAASGSSPAYFFLLLETMQEALVKMGLAPEMARELVVQSMLGAATIAQQNPQTELAQLRQNVTSKGGTTAAAIAVFEQQNLAQTVELALQACAARSEQMGKLF